MEGRERGKGGREKRREERREGENEAGWEREREGERGRERDENREGAAVGGGMEVTWDGNCTEGRLEKREKGRDGG